MKKLLYFLFIALIFNACVKNNYSSKNAKKGYISVFDTQLYYEVYGKGESILLLHGGFLDNRMWDEQKIYFTKKGYKVIVCDMVGHGKTKEGRDKFKMVDGIKTLMDSLKIERFNIVGHSLGAVVAIDFVLKYPNSIQKLVLVSSGLRDMRNIPKEDSLLKKNDSLMGNAYFKLKDKNLVAEYFISSWFDGPLRNPTQIKPIPRNKALKMAIDKVNKGFNFDPQFDTTAVMPKLKEIKQQTLILLGEKDNQIIKTITEILNKNIPNNQLHTISQVAHMINMEKPQEFNQLLLKFLSK